MNADDRADLAESMVPVACDLACHVRDADAEGIARLAEVNGWDERTAALLVVLAAMIPVEDASPNDLLEWTGGLEKALEWRQLPLVTATPGRPVEQPCGTYAAWCRHKRRGEEPCRACYRAWQEYRAERRVARKEQQRQGEAAA